MMNFFLNVIGPTTALLGVFAAMVIRLRILRRAANSAARSRRAKIVAGNASALVTRPEVVYYSSRVNQASSMTPQAVAVPSANAVTVQAMPNTTVEVH
jgi:hypothetical protein